MSALAASKAQLAVTPIIVLQQLGLVTRHSMCCIAESRGCMRVLTKQACTLPLFCHRYKYIYIRSPKSASTSIVNVLGECDNVRTRGYNSSSCMALHFYWPKSVLEMESLQQMWKDYFVFGFVRNPWRRAYSLYKYIHSNGCMDK